MNVYIVCSPGGHLTQALNALETFEGCDVFLVTLDFPNLRDISLKGIKKIHRVRLRFDYSMSLGVPVTLFLSFFQMIGLFLRKRPHIIFSTGSEIAIPAFLAGKLFFRTKLIFMESLTRIQELSLTGKVLYRFADLFLVQWEGLAGRVSNAVYKGRLI